MQQAIKILWKAVPSLYVLGEKTAFLTREKLGVTWTWINKLVGVAPDVPDLNPSHMSLSDIPRIYLSRYPFVLSSIPPPIDLLFYIKKSVKASCFGHLTFLWKSHVHVKLLKLECFFVVFVVVNQPYVNLVPESSQKAHIKIKWGGSRKYNLFFSYTVHDAWHVSGKTSIFC